MGWNFAADCCSTVVVLGGVSSGSCTVPARPQVVPSSKATERQTQERVQVCEIPQGRQPRCQDSTRRILTLNPNPNPRTYDPQTVDPCSCWRSDRQASTPLPAAWERCCEGEQKFGGRGVAALDRTDGGGQSGAHASWMGCGASHARQRLHHIGGVFRVQEPRIGYIGLRQGIVFSSVPMSARCMHAGQTSADPPGAALSVRLGADGCSPCFAPGSPPLRRRVAARSKARCRVSELSSSPPAVDSTASTCNHCPGHVAPRRRGFQSSGCSGRCRGAEPVAPGEPRPPLACSHACMRKYQRQQEPPAAPAHHSSPRHPPLHSKQENLPQAQARRDQYVAILGSQATQRHSCCLHSLPAWEAQPRAPPQTEGLQSSAWEAHLRLRVPDDGPEPVRIAAGVPRGRHHRPHTGAHRCGCEQQQRRRQPAPQPRRRPRLLCTPRRPSAALRLTPAAPGLFGSLWHRRRTARPFHHDPVRSGIEAMKPGKRSCSERRQVRCGFCGRRSGTAAHLRHRCRCRCRPPIPTLSRWKRGPHSSAHCRRWQPACWPALCFLPCVHWHESAVMPACF